MRASLACTSREYVPGRDQICNESGPFTTNLKRRFEGRMSIRDLFFPQDRFELVVYLRSDTAILIPSRDTAELACSINLPS